MLPKNPNFAADIFGASLWRLEPDHLPDPPDRSSGRCKTVFRSDRKSPDETLSCRMTFLKQLKHI